MIELPEKMTLTFTSDDLAVIRDFYIAAVARAENMDGFSQMYHLICRLTREEKEGAGGNDP